MALHTLSLERIAKCCSSVKCPKPVSVHNREVTVAHSSNCKVHSLSSSISACTCSCPLPSLQLTALQWFFETHCVIRKAAVIIWWRWPRAASYKVVVVHSLWLYLNSLRTKRYVPESYHCIVIYWSNSITPRTIVDIRFYCYLYSMGKKIGNASEPAIY